MTTKDMIECLLDGKPREDSHFEYHYNLDYDEKIENPLVIWNKERNVNTNMNIDVRVLHDGIYYRPSSVHVEHSFGCTPMLEIKCPVDHVAYNTIEPKKKLNLKTPGIRKVVFNPPATIVLWDDDTKTVVKCGENDMFDPEKGLSMAITKKALGNTGHYFETIKRWTKNYVDPTEYEIVTFNDFLKCENSFGSYMKKLFNIGGDNNESSEPENG